MKTSNGETTLKDIKTKYLVNNESLKSKISEKLKLHEFLSFKTLQKEIIF